MGYVIDIVSYERNPFSKRAPFGKKKKKQKIGQLMNSKKREKTRKKGAS